MTSDFEKRAVMDPSGFVVLADYVPGIVQEIRYYSTYNFVGDRIDGYEEPCALLTTEAARALKTVSNEMLQTHVHIFHPENTVPRASVTLQKMDLCP